MGRPTPRDVPPSGSPIDRDREPAWRRYLRFWRGNAADDVRDEVAFHLESAVDELVASGLSHAEARRVASTRFGDVDSIHSALFTLSEQRERDMARSNRLDVLVKDVIFAWRQLRRTPMFTATAVFTLALGIGATSAIFSVVDSVLLQPLPYAHADRVITFAQQNGSEQNCCLPYGNYETWRHESSAFEAIGALTGGGSLTLTGQGDPTPIRTTHASAGYWKALFIPPVLGRYFTESEDRDGAPGVAVLSHALWKSRFGGDSGIVGRIIMLNARPVTVVGVAPQDYVLVPPAERVWVPLAPEPSRLRDFSDHELSVYGLLKPGVSAAVGLRQVRQIDTRLAHEHPHSGYDGGVAGTPLVDSVVGALRPRLYMLLGAVGLVLLIACGNIANLLLARANVRRGEMAIRGALGATRGRIVMQLLVESAILALGGAVMGLGVAAVGMRFLVTSPAQVPRLDHTTLNGQVVLFTLVLAAGCAILFGLAPAVRAVRLDLQQTLRDGGRDSRGSVRERLRGALVMSELCIAQVLLIGAALLIRSSLLLQAVPAGFDTRNLLATTVLLPSARYADDGRIEAGFDQIERAIAAIPGVKAVGRSQVAPIYGGGWNWTAMREGSDGHDAGATVADMRFVSAGYFSVLGEPVLRGRAFAASDGAGAPRVAIVSRSLAKRLYGDNDAIGRRISNGSAEKPAWREIVGVVEDIRSNGLAEDPPRVLFLPSMQQSNPGQTLLIRGSVPVAALMPQIRRALASVDPLLALSNTSTMEQAIDKQLAMSRFTTWLLTLLGATGLILAIVGVYGVVAYFVTQRTHEFGVRLALGASSGAVQWLVVRQGITIGIGGAIIGVGLSLLAARLLSSMVYGITPHDPMTFAAITALLAVVTVAASYIPARRATRIDPLEALRST